MSEVERLLRELAQAQQEAGLVAQENHARNHAELAAEMQSKILALSLLQSEIHKGATAGRVGPPVELLDAEQVEARKRAIMRRGGFKV